MIKSIPTAREIFLVSGPCCRLIKPFDDDTLGIGTGCGESMNNPGRRDPVKTEEHWYSPTSRES